MPHVSSSGGDDLGSTDEVKVFKDEGDGEDEKRSSENLTEEKSSLIDLTESEPFFLQEKSGGNYTASKNATRPDHSPVFGKVEPSAHTSSFNMGYLVSPYGYANGAAGPIPVSMAGKMGLGPTGHPGAGLPFFCHNGDPMSQPPPAHMGIPPYQLDGKAGSMGEYGRNASISPAEWRRLLATTGLTRPPMYPFSTGQYPYPMLSPEMSQVAASWHTPTMYPLSPGAGFRSPYPSTLPISTSSLPTDFYRFSPTGLIPPHPGLSPHGPHLPSHPAIVTPGPKQELPDLNHSRYARTQVDQKNNVGDGKNNQDSNNAADKKKPHIKKPLNAFMLYMKEMRAKVVAECTLKESAAINQILGRKWHALGREEQAKYYELARRERQLHMQLYPDWSSRANATRGKKRKRKQDPADGGNSMKKCRARYGLDQQSQWCKPCRRKKKCIRYMEAGDTNDGNQSDDNLGSCGSMGDAHTPPEDDAESLNQSMSSPGGLSALSSLTSPGGVVLPSPSTSVASPSVSVASPYMLQSPLTPHEAFDVKLPPPPQQQQHLQHPPRNPVGTNPHDINNPLSVNQLTGQCVKNEPPDSGPKDPTRSIISVT
ncbi:PREDICTED: protein pangolin, isoforms A/H/I/S isoform X3 [Nicrophorus vespilloides]|uniref:Protein pangolin, isoforms A/H/I/S isoform X3 n=2 Tax=Nicrophorus vespilloides TaxID=110193 RepID=A0ABM1MV97_NICVS|nr:PREDICTED: protein pangolin, isoforms A/H/I/S isoform X3 [Nicrophorus vespilloides]